MIASAEVLGSPTARFRSRVHHPRIRPASTRPTRRLALSDWVAMQLICPCLIGRKDLMTRSYPAAVGDTANAGSDKSLRRDAGHDTSSRN